MSILLLIIFMFTGCATANLSVNHDQKFTPTEEKHLRPVKVFISNRELAKNGNVFLLESDSQVPLWGPRESEWQLNRYNVNSSQVEETFFKLNAEQGVLVDSVSSESYICWVVVSQEGPYILYVYDIKKKEITKKQVADDYSEIADFPLSLTINNSHASWIEHNIKSEQSVLKLYSINEKSVTDIEAAPFTDGKIPVTMFFSELGEAGLFYDRINGDGQISIIRYDPAEKNNKDVFTVAPVNDLEVKLNYGASYDNSENKLALYAQSEKGDFIYIFDPESKSTSFVQPVSDGILYNDELTYHHNIIFYSLVKAVSADLLQFTGKRVDAASGEAKTLEGCHYFGCSENFLGSLYSEINEDEFFTRLGIVSK